MNFWWVNHNQTFKHEVGAGYIWSPQQNKNGSRNQTYINLTRTAIGDIVFSYADTKIPAVGKVIAIPIESQRPPEFGSVGHQWNNLGWLVRIKWLELTYPVRPRDFMDELAPLRPTKHSPIRQNGNGNQGVYLAEISSAMGKNLLGIIAEINVAIYDELDAIDYERQENDEEEQIIQSPLPNTQKQQLIQARRGQGLFRINLERVESKCRVTGLADKRVLIASHIKPWKNGTNEERLDGYNGFLLSPHVDKLFDKGWISFDNFGKLLLSSKNVLPILKVWSIDPDMSVGAFTSKQKVYLDYHRSIIFSR